MEQMKDVYIVQCLMETDLYKLLKTQVRIRIFDCSRCATEKPGELFARLKFSRFAGH